MAGKPGCGGKKGRSGRKKTIESFIQEDIAKRQTNIPKYFDALEYRALGGNIHCPECGHEFGFGKEPDREALEYLIDRQMGKPTQKSEIDMSGGLSISRPQVFDVWLQLVEIERGQTMYMGKRIEYLENLLTEANIPFDNQGPKYLTTGEEHETTGEVEPDAIQ